jgi:spermidine synthase
MLFAGTPVRSVGVMGGGDGLVARELLRHFGDELERVRIVDIDPAVTDLARTHPRLAALNEGSLSDPRVEVVNGDARAHRSDEPYDLILCDLPDPTSGPLAGLYTREFYAGLAAQLRPGTGILGLQIPYVPRLFDGILATLRSVYASVREYSVRMYSFVHVGFGVAAMRGAAERNRELPAGTRYLTPEVVECLFRFPPDEPRVPVDEVATDANGRIEEWYAAWLRDRVEERILYF